MEELLSGSDPEDPCSPFMVDTDGDGWCDMEEIINGTSPTTAESVTAVGALDGQNAVLAISVQGFGLACSDCYGISWYLLDATGRTVKSGRLEAWNGWSVGPGVHILSLPELGLYDRVVIPE